MAYKIKYQKQAVLDAARLQRSEPNAFKKLLKLESELREHPHWHRPSRAVARRPLQSMEPPYHAKTPPRI